MLKKYLRTPVVIFPLLLFLFPYSSAISESFTDTSESFSIRDYFTQTDFARQNNLNKLTQFSSKDIKVYLAQAEDEEEMFEDVYAFESKSVKRAFLYSFILPGAGEFYSNSKIKAGLFLGLEALFWVGYFDFHKRGSDKRDEYKTWADKYWDETRFKESILKYYDVDIDTLDKESTIDTSFKSSELSDSLKIIHQLPNSKDQQYYEMIGKYHEFRYGWEDYNPYDKNYWTLLRLYYWEMRKHSNRSFDKARYFMIASLANHVISAFDAAFTVRSYNKKGERFSKIKMNMKLAQYEKELVPFLTLSVKF